MIRVKWVVFAATLLQHRGQIVLTMGNAPGPLTRMMPKAPPGAVASAQIVDASPEPAEEEENRFPSTAEGEEKSPPSTDEGEEN